MEKAITHKKTLTHSEFNEIVSEAKRSGSLKDAFLEHGITDVENLFPEVQSVNKEPNLVGRDTSWVTDALSRVRHIPFSRIKSIYANITEDEARAKGYIKGKQKVEEVFPVLKRSTDPTTIYKLQKMDRDDIIDITDFDVIAWIKNEMRTMLNEEIARAIFIGDGRSLTDNDHINENNVRPILTDDPVFAVHKVLEKTKSQSDDDFTKNFIKEVVKSRKDYKGSGDPVFYTTEDMLTNMLLLEDEYGRTLYQSQEALATALRVSKIVAVPVFDNIGHEDGAISYELLGIMVNLADYTIGADKGGQVSLFDDFDIDYNKQSYLIETRCSGALTVPYSAVTFEKKIDNTVHVTGAEIGNGAISGYYTLDEGDNYLFYVLVKPRNATNKEFKWSSSDNSKATIDSEGNMTTKSPGDVVITGTSVDNPDVKVTCRVTIRPLPSTVTLNKTTTTIEKGLAERLTATVKPDGADSTVLWYSDNQAVARVDEFSGTVIAVSAGKTNIKAVAGHYKDIFATCEVTVTVFVLVDSITLNKTGTVNVNTGDTLQLTATVKPDDATDKTILWSTDNSTVADVSSSGLVSFKKAGTAKISAESARSPSVFTNVTFNVTDAQATS